MKIAVIGASGLIGTKVVDLPTAEGHDVVAPRQGVVNIVGPEKISFEQMARPTRYFCPARAAARPASSPEAT
jgi:hypothetical protein